MSAFLLCFEHFFFSLEKLLGVVWSYWVRVKVRVVNFLSRFFLFCQNVEHEYFFLTLKIIPPIGKNIFFWTTQHAKFFHSICSCVNIFWYFLITFLTIPHYLLVIILFHLGIKSLTRLASYSLRLMALAFFWSHWQNTPSESMSLLLPNIKWTRTSGQDKNDFPTACPLIKSYFYQLTI